MEEISDGDFHDIINKVNFFNKKLSNVVKSFNFLRVNNDKSLDQKFINNLKESKVIIINHYHDPKQENSNEFFLIVYEKSLIIFDKSDHILTDLLKSKEELKICFLQNVQKESAQLFNNKYEEIKFTSILQEELSSFCQSLIIRETNQSTYDFIDSIFKSIFCYLIIKSYFKLSKNRIHDIQVKKGNVSENESFNKDDYITLRNVGIGLKFSVELIYHIEKEELFAIKKININDSETKKLIEREKENYLSMNHPFLPNFYGRSTNGLVIEFINGQTLYDIDQIHLDDNEKITIIFEIMLVLEFIHLNHFVYRDLKPNNIMYTNKTVVLIDFDRMIKNNINENILNQTVDFSSPFIAPEINLGQISDKNDIYSLGQIIFYIMNEKLPISNEINQTDRLNKYPEMKEIYEQCTNKEPQKRPSITNLIFDFAIKFFTQIQIQNLSDLYESYSDIHLLEEEHINALKNILINNSIAKRYFLISYFYLHGQYVPKNTNKYIYYLKKSADQNFVEAQYQLGNVYYQGEFVAININKSIQYFTLAANQNHKKAQYSLGVIYQDGKFVPIDIQKSIYYYTMAANNNHANSQLILGDIYYSEKYIPQDISKAIHFFSLAANNNDAEAQFNLGSIYFSMNKYDKAIHYFTLAAKNNYLNAQNNLGYIYIQGIGIKQDIEKAIYYFKMAADQNCLFAQFALGIIYSQNVYLPVNINKAIYYYTLAANQNYADAQYNLGLIYYKGQYVKGDVYNAIQYFTQASYQNHSPSLNSLGIIYYKEKYFKCDINKAINFFTRSANLNNIDANYFLGEIYYNGFHEIKRDIKKALYYFQIAAAKNHSFALFSLGFIYYKGEYELSDINKAIYYFTLSAKQNNEVAQFYLGEIYHLNQNVARDIKKAIYYYSQAASKNYPYAHYNLGVIYYEGIYVPCDIKKALYHFSLGAEQNEKDCLLALGKFYYEGKYIQQNINKSIQLLTNAANQNQENAQFALGSIYYRWHDFKKALQYYISAAKQNHPQAQYMAGFIYYYNLINSQVNEVEKAIEWLTRSSNNEYLNAHFMLGFAYHEGRKIKRDIEKAIIFYKKGSSLNSKYAKNNLGVIYKNDFEVPKNIFYAIELFNEAIRQNNDLLSMFNLANILFYEETIQKNDEKLLKLLIDSSKRNFFPSQELLCLFMIKKNGLNMDKIKKEIDEYYGESNDLSEIICKMILFRKFNDNKFFTLVYNSYKHIEYIYDSYHNIIPLEMIYQNEYELKSNNCTDINNDFYDGFGIQEFLK